MKIKWRDKKELLSDKMKQIWAFLSTVSNTITPNDNLLMANPNDNLSTAHLNNLSMANLNDNLSIAS